MKKNMLFIAGTILFVSCSGGSSSDSKKGEVVSNIAAGGESDAAFIQDNAARIKQEEAALKEEAANFTSMKFDKEFHDFGVIAAGSENKCVFKVTNTGNKPLIIQNVGASCGCTTPKKPENPIAPGKSDVIEVGFKPNGSGPVEKIVTIQANTEPRVQTVKVRATIQ